jgi:sugar-specific transcriptional regulator TrmB
MLNLILNPLEEKVYTFILENPYKDITDIIKGCKLHRPLGYKIINSLLQKKFILVQMSGKRKAYVPENPGKLFDEFVNLEYKIKNLTRELKEKYNKNINDLKITEYKGKYGIRSAYREMLENTKHKSNLYRIESLEATKRMRDYYPEIYRARAFEHGDLSKYVITNDKKSKTRSPRMNRYTKTVNSEEFKLEDNAFEVISDKNVLFVDLNSEQAFLFEGEKFAEFQRNVFKILYKKL